MLVRDGQIQSKEMEGKIRNFFVCIEFSKILCISKRELISVNSMANNNRSFLESIEEDNRTNN